MRVGKPWLKAGEVFGAKMEGLDKLIKELETLGVNSKKALVGATRAGMKVIQAEAETNAQQILSRRGKATRIVTQSKKPTHATMQLGASKKRYYLRFHETGVQAHEIKGPLVFEGERGLVVIGGVRHPGMPATPWLRPAFDTTREDAKEAFGAELKAMVEQARIAAEGKDDEE